ncbi:MAG: HAD hydrolase-like protein, partial [Chloroflexota bacterium]
AIEACTGAKADAIVGKPSVHMAAAVLGRLGLPAGETLLVGDRLATDMRMARAVGMAGALVLTGATTLAEAESAAEPPDYVIAGLRDLLPPMVCPVPSPSGRRLGRGP